MLGHPERGRLEWAGASWSGAAAGHGCPTSVPSTRAPIHPGARTHSGPTAQHSWVPICSLEASFLLRVLMLVEGSPPESCLRAFSPFTAPVSLGLCRVSPFILQTSLRRSLPIWETTRPSALGHPSLLQSVSGVRRAWTPDSGVGAPPLPLIWAWASSTSPGPAGKKAGCRV